MSKTRKQLLAFGETANKLLGIVQEPSDVVKKIEANADAVTTLLVSCSEALSNFNTQMTQLSTALLSNTLPKSQQVVCFEALTKTFYNIEAFRTQLIESNNALYMEFSKQIDKAKLQKTGEKFTELQTLFDKFKTKNLESLAPSEKELLTIIEKLMLVGKELITANLELKKVTESKETKEKVKKEKYILPSRCAQAVTLFDTGVDAVKGNLLFLFNQYGYVPPSSTYGALFTPEKYAGSTAALHKRKAKA